MNKLLIICGPTATGKTALAAGLAKRFNGELISADSRQVYRGMDLVTGKDRPDVPIWLYDVVNPDEEFSVSQWVKLAAAATGDIRKRGKLPIVVGGTGLYIQALLKPFHTIDIPPDKKLRKSLWQASVREMQEMLEPKILEMMNESDRNNPRRLIRKLEITQSKRNMQVHAKEHDALLIGLTTQLDELDRRIDTRLHQRIQAGMMDEIKCLQNYSPHLPAMSAIGVNEHAYAKRQMTWFRKQKDIHWFDITQDNFFEKIASLVRKWYN